MNHSRLIGAALALALSTGSAFAATPSPTPPQNGGTGKANNKASTIAISGAHPLTVTLTETTGVTFPASGLLISDATLSAEIDAVFGSAQGDILYRNATVWTVLTPATAGWALTTQGAAANPQWAAVSGGSGCTVSGGSQYQILVNNGSSDCSSSANASVQIGALALGASGTLGSVSMGNATSGTVLLRPVTGALGTVTVSIPAATDTLVNLGGTQTLTNKTLTAPTLTSPALGTPASGLGTNLTGLPIAALVGGGTGVTGALAANVTGSGGIVLATSPTIASPTFSGTAAGAGTIPGTLLVSTAVSPASYGLSTSIPTITVDQQGRITAASSNVVIAPAATLSGSTLASGVTASSLTSAAGGSFGTAAFVATGTSGATIPLLNAGNTYSGVSTFTGALKVPMRKVTVAGAVTVSATTDYFVCVDKGTGAATTVNLPAGVAGLTFLVKDCKGDAASNNITVTPASGTIDGAATAVISTAYGSMAVTYNSSEWSIN